MAGTKVHRDWGYVGTMRSGRYQASYVGPDRQRHYAPTTYSHKSIAESWLGDERRRIEFGIWEPPAVKVAADRAPVEKPITLREFAETWLKQRRLKPRSRSLNDSQLQRLILPTLGQVAVEDLTPKLLRDWRSGLDTKYPTRNAQCYGLLHAILATAVDDDILLKNPCREKGITNVKAKRVPVIPHREAARRAGRRGAETVRGNGPRRRLVRSALRGGCGVAAQ